MDKAKAAILQNVNPPFTQGTDVMCGKIVKDSVWRVQMTRKFNAILAASAGIPEARQVCEEGYKSIKHSLDIQKSVSCMNEFGSAPRTILDPPRSRPKGERNKRNRTTVEKQCKIVKV
ncbi:unnamed protein product [Cuscuta epithymum]|uniref:Uncharacterized protein n=1 Tax=Cuscuta epithymum TaxID=186058 RepID=A0AAV0GCX6_9ASTE|nr:unnamed protein product [Cuscuta epithymum]